MSAMFGLPQLRAKPIGSELGHKTQHTKGQTPRKHGLSPQLSMVVFGSISHGASEAWINYI